MLLSARVSIALIVVSGLLAIGCGKKEEEPVVMTMPSAAVAPVKAVEDTPQAQPAAADSAAADPAAAAAANTPPPAAEPPKPVAQASIDGCCSALAAMVKDAKSDAALRAKATSASAMCASMAKLVKEGKGSRSTALTQIKATMVGKAPAACN